MEPLFELNSYWLIALTLIAFFAGYIDAVAGGGGMLNLPALLFAGKLCRWMAGKSFGG